MNEKLIQMLAQYMQSAEPVSTKVEHGHTAIDKEIEKYKHTMSEDPGKQIIAPGLGLLDMVGGFSKAGALIPAGSKKFLNIINRLKASTNFSPSKREAAISYAKKLRGTSPAKYKDAPTRELMDIVLKLDDLMIKSPKSRAVQESRYTVDKNLLKAMEEIQRTGMSGTIKPGTEANIKNTFRILMELMR